jgi:hypothetical protein
MGSTDLVKIPLLNGGKTSSDPSSFALITPSWTISMRRYMDLLYLMVGVKHLRRKCFTPGRSTNNDLQIKRGQGAYARFRADGYIPRAVGAGDLVIIGLPRCQASQNELVRVAE